MAGCKRATQTCYVNNSEHNWMSSAYKSDIPSNAVVGGKDCNGDFKIFVGRAWHKGKILPAKVIPRRGCAFVSWRGSEYKKFKYDVLLGEGYSWVSSSNGNVPPNAVSTGTTTSDGPFYVGRVRHRTSLTVGRIHPSDHCLYIPFAHGEKRFTDSYEALVYERPHNWVSPTPNYTLSDAVVAGHDTNRAPIYVGRALHEGEMLPAKILPSEGRAYVCSNGCEVNKDNNFELLTGCGYNWLKPHGHVIPPKAVSTGKSLNGQTLFIGRGSHLGSVTPGLVSESESCLYIPYKGQQIRIDCYEVLVTQ